MRQWKPFTKLLQADSMCKIKCFPSLFEAIYEYKKGFINDSIH